MIELKAINKTFVADIAGLEVRALTDTEFDEIYAAWLMRKTGTEKRGQIYLLPPIVT